MYRDMLDRAVRALNPQGSDFDLTTITSRNRVAFRALLPTPTRRRHRPSALYKRIRAPRRDTLRDLQVEMVDFRSAA